LSPTFSWLFFSKVSAANYFPLFIPNRISPSLDQYREVEKILIDHYNIFDLRFTGPPEQTFAPESFKAYSFKQMCPGETLP
jgi:hypothetical protein